MNKINAIAVLAIIAAIITSSCHSEKQEEESVVFQITSPLKKDTSISREYVCVIKAYQHTEIRALEKGYLQKIYVDEGKPVKQGQVMFQLLPIVYQAERQKAAAEVNYAEVEYQNAQQLAEKNVISPNELALAKAKLEKAKAELALAEAHLKFTEIIAPFDGLMDKFNVRLGALLDEGEVLTTLSDISKLWVYFNVPEPEYLDFKKHFRSDSSISVRLRMANGEIFQHKGVIETIESDFDNETGNIAFRAGFPNPERLLRHGETGNIILTFPFKNAILIPQKATFEVLEKKFVYVVDKNNVVHTREIEIAGELQDIFIVKKGLSENDRIVLEGIRKLKDGDKLKEFKYIEPAKVYNHLKVYAE
ncbi:MAG: hemolysin D [Bacteroidia bacterium]|nr:MAG: hemolysin D [Bacteroidia bacterium]